MNRVWKGILANKLKIFILNFFLNFNMFYGHLKNDDSTHFNGES